MQEKYEVIELLEFASLVEESIKNVINYRLMLESPLFQEFGGPNHFEDFDEMYVFHMLTFLDSEVHKLREAFLRKARIGTVEE